MRRKSPGWRRTLEVVQVGRIGSRPSRAHRTSTEVPVRAPVNRRKSEAASSEDRNSQEVITSHQKSRVAAHRGVRKPPTRAHHVEVAGGHRCAAKVPVLGTEVAGSLPLRSFIRFLQVFRSRKTVRHRQRKSQSWACKSWEVTATQLCSFIFDTGLLLRTARTVYRRLEPGGVHYGHADEGECWESRLFVHHPCPPCAGVIDWRPFCFAAHDRFAVHDVLNGVSIAHEWKSLSAESEKIIYLLRVLPNGTQGLLRETAIASSGHG
jgi:hypothetical protein